MLVSTAGGVPQYYGGNLLGALTAALASGPQATQAAFQRWTPEGYGGLLDEMKLATLDSLPEIGGYETLHPGHVFTTGTIRRSAIDGRDRDGYLANSYRDTAYTIGVAGDLPFAQLGLSYSRIQGGFHDASLNADAHGNQVNGTISVPVTHDEALRLSGRVAYGDYSADGTRQTLSDPARFRTKGASNLVYGAGVEYLKSFGRLSVDGTAEYLGIRQKSKSFTETGAASAFDLFTIEGQSRTARLIAADARLGYSLSSRVGVYAKAGYQHDIGQATTDLTAHQLIDPVSVEVTGAGLNRDRIDGALGANIEVVKSVQLNLEGGAGSSSAYHFGGGVRVNF